MDTEKTRHLKILEGYPADVVALEAHGRVTRADYEDILIPEVEKAARAEGRVKLLYILGPEFAGYSAGAAWDDAKFGLLHLGQFSRLAVVTDVEWIRMAVKAFAPLIPAPVALFHVAETEAAKDWIAEWKDEQPETGHEVAAERKLPTLEDRM